jgi:FkbM family methyltransferase
MIFSLVERLTKLSPDSLLGSLVRAPLKLIPRDRVMRVRRGVNQGASWVAGASVHGCWLGTYESDKQELIARLATPGMTLWDVGANAGFYTLAFSRLTGPRGRVYAFEPLAENADNLRTHVRLNDVRNVTVVEAAVGAADGTVGFAVAASNAMGRVSAGASDRVVPCVTLDSFVEQHPEAAPDLLKVDIEGGESALLVGGARFLARNTPPIVLSLHGTDQQRRCGQLLESFGYSAFRLDGTALDHGAISDEILARRRGLH